MELKDKVAIVTGAASGIGAATARLMSACGASVVLADMDPSGESLASELRSEGGRALFQQTDICNDNECEALVQSALRHHGRLDLAFNNAGIAGTPALTGETPLALWRKVIDTNLTGTFNCMVHEVRAMQAGGGGAIVNTASIKAFTGARGASAYSASKHGVLGLTRSAALEYGKHGIRINAVCPGYIETPMTSGESDLSAKVIQQMLAGAAIRRLGTAREVAELVLWLLSDRARYVTGADFVVDGGVTA